MFFPYSAAKDTLEKKARIDLCFLRDFIQPANTRKQRMALSIIK